MAYSREAEREKHEEKGGIGEALHTSQKTYSKLASTAAAGLLRLVNRPLDLIDRVGNLRENYKTNIERGHSPGISSIAASTALLANLGTKGLAWMEQETGLAMAVTGVGTPMAVALIAGGTYTYSQSDQVGKTVNAAVPLLVDGPVNIASHFYQSTMEFIEQTSKTLACYPAANPLPKYTSLESAMAELGYFQHCQRIFQSQQLAAQDIPLFDLLSYQVFSEYFALNSQGQLIPTAKKPPTLDTPPSSSTHLKKELEQANQELGEYLQSQQADLAVTKASMSSVQVNFDKMAASHARESAFTLSTQDKVTLRSFGDSCQHVGSILCNVSTAAVMLGGHARTWRGVQGAGSGLLSAASGFTTLSSASSYTGLAAMTGYAGIAVGALTVAMNLFGDSQEDDGLEIIMQAMHALQQNINALRQDVRALHSDMLKGFRQLEQLIWENTAVTIHRLSQVNAKLDRLERIVTVSFQELHSKQLIDTVDAISKAMKGEYKLENTEIGRCLRDLSSWVDYHSRAVIQTSICRDSKDASKTLEILSNEDFDLEAMLPFFIVQLHRLLPSNLLNAKIDDLPNVTLLVMVSEVYASAVSRYQFQEQHAPTLTRAKSRLEYIISLVNSIFKKHQEILEILYRQYEHARFQVGRALEKCFSEFTIKPGTPLAQHLKIGVNTENLMFALDQLELRRIMLLRLNELCNFENSIVANIKELESKKAILDQPADIYAAEAAKVFNVVDYHKTYNIPEFKKVSELKRILEMGASINGWDDFGQAVHKLCSWYSTCSLSMLLHLLQKTGNLEMQNGTRKEFSLAFTGNNNPKPIQLIINRCHFELAILYCANGGDISEAESTPIGWDATATDLHNIMQRKLSDKWEYIVQRDFIKEMNSEASPLNKKSLRKAYEFYKAVEAGHDVSPEGISHDCVLVLVAILGDLRPLLALGRLRTNINRSLTTSHFTLFMLAVFCGRENVVNYLLSRGVNSSAHGEFINFGIDRNRSHLYKEAPGQSSFGFFSSRGEKLTADEVLNSPWIRKFTTALDLATQKGHWLIANRLMLRESPRVMQDYDKHGNNPYKNFNPQYKQIIVSVKHCDPATRRDASPTYCHMFSHYPDMSQLASEGVPFIFQPVQLVDTKMIAQVNETIAKVELAITPQQLVPVTAINPSDNGKDLLRVYDECKVFYKLLPIIVKKIPPNQHEMQQMVNAQMTKLKEAMGNSEKLIGPSGLNDKVKGLHLLKDISATFNLLNAILKTIPDFNYSIGENVDSMLRKLDHEIQSIENDVRSKASVESSPSIGGLFSASVPLMASSNAHFSAV
ncbi:MAG TPA: hypothetical protein VGV92_05740, partial [Gammaproteobacteria bacterium]|nr:hypothetical protein [Gammaproteobacteria bacterium]